MNAAIPAANQRTRFGSSDSPPTGSGEPQVLPSVAADQLKAMAGKYLPGALSGPANDVITLGQAMGQDVVNGVSHAAGSVVPSENTLINAPFRWMRRVAHKVSNGVRTACLGATVLTAGCAATSAATPLVVDQTRLDQGPKEVLVQGAGYGTVLGAGLTGLGLAGAAGAHLVSRSTRRKEDDEPAATTAQAEIKPGADTPS